MEPSEFLACLSVRDFSGYDPSLTLSWLEVGNKEHMTQGIKAGVNHAWFLE